MRKNATKIAAMMLSLALTVTSVNIPTTSSAAAKVKLSASKATLYVGGSSAKKTKTLKATFNGKKVKATFTSSNSKVAKVGKKTGKVTAVKKGSATITAKYKGKKATAKITVKQYVTKVTASQDVVELKEGEHINLSKMITVSPAGASNKAVSYKSDDSLVAAVNSKGTVLKGVKEGTTAITVTAKDGSKKKTTVRVNVTKGDVSTSDPSVAPSDKEAKNVEISVENPFSEEYKNTLLVGTNAQVKVRVTDEDGKPVANREVVLSSKTLDGKTTVYTNAFRNLSDAAKRTDSNGYVTFVYGLSVTHDQAGDPIDATSSEYVSSYKLTASVSNNVEASVDVKFGALDSDSLTNVNIVNGTQAGYVQAPTSDDGGMSFSTLTKGRLGRNNDVNYVSSQKVSPQGTASNKVGIVAGVPSLLLPGAETTEASDVKETVSFDTGKYSTYTTKNWGKVIDSVKASKLQYATVNFGKLSLSKYTRFVVQAYIVNDPANPTAPGGFRKIDIMGTNAAAGSSYTVSGEKVSGDFAVQIPIDEKADGYLYVTAVVESKGQVNTDVNDGFTVKNVLGVHRKGAVDKQTVPLKDVTIQWEQDTEATYTLEKEVPAGAIRDALDAKYAGTNKAYTYIYKVPAFPRTGNAIITVLDSTKKVVDYYVIPTVNKADSSSVTGYTNQNVLRDTAADLHRVSKDEALNQVGTVTSTAAGVAEVNSEKSGVTHVIGTLTSTNPNIKIDATNAKVYSSVHWNPIPEAVATKTHAKGAALVGQQIVLKAQLADQNGNPVALRGQSVEFYYDGDKILKTDVNVGKASVVKVDTETNELGQAELVLVSDKAISVNGISAKTGTQGSGYRLGYALGGQTVTADHVDLYWLDANLYFEPNANTTEKISTSAAEPAKITTGHPDIKPVVGSHWAYEVRAEGELVPSCGLAGFNANVAISGLNIQTTVGTGSVGTVSDNANGKANVTSTKAGSTKLVNVLDRNSLGNEIKFTATNGIITEDIPYVGVGVTTLDKKFTLDIDWNAGIPTADIIVPTGYKADITEATANGVKVYVQVHDANGNVLVNKDVKLKVTGSKGAVDGVDTVKTNDLGIASFTVKPAGGAVSGDAATLVAEAADIAGVFSSSIKWVDVTSLPAVKVENVVYDYNAKTIKLTFNSNVYAPSIVKEQFEVLYGGKKQLVTDIEIGNNSVTLKVPGLVSVDLQHYFQVTIDPATKDTIEYKFVSVDGKFLDVADKTIQFDSLGRDEATNGGTFDPSGDITTQP